MLWHRQFISDVQDLANEIAEFATRLATDFGDFIAGLPSPAELMQSARNHINEYTRADLCVSPTSCIPGLDHVNSGEEQDLVPDLDAIEILESHHHIAALQRAAIAPAHALKYFAHTCIHSSHNRWSTSRVIQTAWAYPSAAPRTREPPRVCGPMCGTGIHDVFRLLQDVRL